MISVREILAPAGEYDSDGSSLTASEGFGGVLGPVATGTDEASPLGLVDSLLLGVTDESYRLWCWYLPALARLNHPQGEGTAGFQNTAHLAQRARLVAARYLVGPLTEWT